MTGNKKASLKNSQNKGGCMKNIQNSDNVGMALHKLKKNVQYCVIMHLSGFGTFGM